VCSILTFFFLSQVPPSVKVLSESDVETLSILGGLVAGLSELLCPIFFPVDDNLVIPLLSGGVLWGYFHFLLHMDPSSVPIAVVDIASF
jgi:dolichol kinase